MPWYNFLHLFILWITSRYLLNHCDSWTYGFHQFSKLSAIIFKNIFLLLPLSLGYSNYTYIWLCKVIPQLTDGLYPPGILCVCVTVSFYIISIAGSSSSVSSLLLILSIVLFRRLLSLEDQFGQFYSFHVSP